MNNNSFVNNVSKLPKAKIVKNILCSRGRFESLIPLIVFSYLLRYINDIEELSNCQCSSDWRRTYIKYFSVFIILLNLLLLILGNDLFCIFKSLKFIAYMILPLTLIQIYALFTYVKHLEKEGCKCATEENLHKFAKYLGWFQIILLIVVIAMIIMNIVLIRN